MNETPIPRIVGRPSKESKTVEDSGRSEALALDCNVTVALEAVEPFGVTEAGLIVHVEPEGAPVQVRFTTALNPPTGVMVRVLVTDEPRVTVLVL